MLFVSRFYSRFYCDNLQYVCDETQKNKQLINILFEPLDFVYCCVYVPIHQNV